MKYVEWGRLFLGAALLIVAGAVASAEPDAGAPAKPMVQKAPVVKLLDNRMQLDSDGSGTVITAIQLDNVTPGRLEIPFGTWGDVEDFQVTEGTADVKMELLARGTVPRLALTLPPAVPSTVSLKLSFRKPAPRAAPAKDAKAEEKKAPERYKTFAHRFLNGTPLVVERYRVEVSLPAGFVVHTVPEALPKAKATETKPRVQLVRKDEHQGAVLEAAGLRFADATSMRIDFEPERKSLAMLWLGVVLSGLYLVFFRDILRPVPSDAREDHSHKAHE